MDHLAHFKIPVKGLSIGMHELRFEIEDDFFKHFENSILDNGTFDVLLYLNKKSDHSELDFSISGSTKQICDRCLEKIDIKLKGDYRMYLKYEEIQTDDEDMIYMTPGDSHISVAQPIFEIISVLMPLRKVCEEKDGVPCNEELLSAIENDDATSESEETTSLWEALKDINIKD